MTAERTVSKRQRALKVSSINAYQLYNEFAKKLSIFFYSILEESQEQLLQLQSQQPQYLQHLQQQRKVKKLLKTQTHS